MKSLRPRTPHLSVAQLNRLIAERFQTSFMNDSKWDRLIEKLTDAFADGIYARYKLIQEDAIFDVYWTEPDHKPFFNEPIIYREVEWIDFPDQYEYYVNQSNLKAGKRRYSQDVHAIETEIRKIGVFELQRLQNNIKLYAYR